VKIDDKFDDAYFRRIKKTKPAAPAADSKEKIFAEESKKKV
jgi:hypothetical protein